MKYSVKRITVAICAVVLLITFTACGNSQKSVDKKSAETSTDLKQIDTNTDSKPLVVYFSRGINTMREKNVDAVTGASLKANGDGFYSDEQVIAEWVAEEVNGDLFAIKTEKKYPIEYDEILEVGKQERVKDERPALSSRIENLNEYQTIYFVYPNWWGDLPMPVYSFFDAYDLSGKKIVAIIISGGGGFAGTISTIRDLEPKAEVVEGVEIYKKDMENAKEKIKAKKIKHCFRETNTP